MEQNQGIGGFLESLRGLSEPHSRYLGIGMEMAKTLPQGQQQGALLNVLQGLGGNLRGFSATNPNTQFGGLGGMLQYLQGIR